MTPDEIQSTAKRDALLTVYQICWQDLSWRRTAGYRTLMFSLGYCGLLLALVGGNHALALSTRIMLAIVVALATLFGAAYMVANYYKYNAALKRMIQIEEFVGAYSPDYLNQYGALMDADRKTLPDVPLMKNAICLGSVIALAAGGLVTAIAVAVG